MNKVIDKIKIYFTNLLMPAFYSSMAKEMLLGKYKKIIILYIKIKTKNLISTDGANFGSVATGYGIYDKYDNEYAENSIHIIYIINSNTILAGLK